jgi:uncharacterized protein (TIGR02996 family)
MLPVGEEHAALLKAVAKNTNDRIIQKAYADWLMEQGSAGWIIVLNYKIHEWPVWEKVKHDDSEWPYYDTFWRLPWIEGRVPCTSISHHLRRIKHILTEYAEGRAVQ